MARRLYVYILASRTRALYVGITNSLQRRLWEHRNPIPDSNAFTARHGIVTLVYYEAFDNARAAIAREKEIKGWKRRRKLALVEKQNPRWMDLGKELGIIQ